MLDCADIGEVSRQFWALMGPLVKNDNGVQAIFANVPRHNGLEAWRRVAEPINDDKTLIRKDLLPLITNPRAATTLDGITTALEDWDTNLRLFREAGGSEPNDESKRLTIVQLLPLDVSAYVAMHMELPELSSYTWDDAFRPQIRQGTAELEAHVWKAPSACP